jgi:hypothetical protein
MDEESVYEQTYQRTVDTYRIVYEVLTALGYAPEAVKTAVIVAIRAFCEKNYKPDYVEKHVNNLTYSVFNQ